VRAGRGKVSTGPLLALWAPGNNGSGGGPVPADPDRPSGHVSPDSDREAGAYRDAGF